MRAFSCAVALMMGGLVTVGPVGRATDPVADLAVVAGADTAHGRVGVVVGIPLKVHSYGPDIIMTGMAVIDVTLPEGTTFLYEGSPRLCEINEPARHRCNTGARIYPDYDNPSGVPGSPTFYIRVVLVSKCSGLGSYKIEYSGDPDTSNNEDVLRVKVDGVDPDECAQASPTSPPTSSPSRPSQGATASGTTSPGVVPTSDMAKQTEPAVAPTTMEGSIPFAGRDVANTSTGRSPANPYPVVVLALGALASAIGVTMVVRRRRAAGRSAHGA